MDERLTADTGSAPDTTMAIVSDDLRVTGDETGTGEQPAPVDFVLETVTRAPIAEDAVPSSAERDYQPTLWDRIAVWLGVGHKLQINQLTDAITAAPDAPMAYVLRGEQQLAAGAFAEAQADFERALMLAEAQLKTDRWGLVTQAAQDRAQAGLADVLNRSVEQEAGR